MRECMHVCVHVRVCMRECVLVVWSWGGVNDFELVIMHVWQFLGVMCSNGEGGR